jgi:linoleoyl-CoA desaturase
MASIQIPKFPAVKDSLTLLELRKRVQAYFDEKGISATGNINLF